MCSVTYCAYFDANYLARGIAMCSSFERALPRSNMLVLCLDDRSYQTMARRDMPGVTLVDRKWFEVRFPVLLSFRHDRKALMAAYKPLLLKLAMERNGPGDFVVHLDADLYFWSNVSELEREIQGASIALCPHRLAASDKHLEPYGRYNGGLIAFRRDQIGIEALDWWCDRVFERCEEDIAHGFYFEQRYLEEIPRLFNSVSELRHPGINLAPWNLASHDIKMDTGTVTVDGKPLVCYHFHGLRELAPRVYDTCLSAYYRGACAVLMRALYVPYVEELRRIQRESSDAAEPVLFGISSAHCYQRDPVPLAWLKALRRPRSLLLYSR